METENIVKNNNNKSLKLSYIKVHRIDSKETKSLNKNSLEKCVKKNKKIIETKKCRTVSNIHCSKSI